MSRNAKIGKLVDDLSAKGDTLVYPDHPLILHGPSVLTLKERTLTASFVYTRGSRPLSSVSEQARVLLARLAYPEHTVFEAIFDEDSVPETFDLGFFDSFRMLTPRSLSQPDGDDAIRAPVVSAVKRLRRPHFARFAANQRGKPQDSPKGAHASFTQFIDSDAPRYKFVDIAPNNLTAYVPKGARALTINRIQRVAETFTANDYGLGLGMSAFMDVAGEIFNDSYLEQHSLRAHLAFDSERIGIDSLKPFRAAQFAGGLVTTSGW